MKMIFFPFISKINVNISYLHFSNVAVTRRTPAGMTMDLFEQHQGTHILQVNWKFLHFARNTT